METGGCLNNVDQIGPEVRVWMERTWSGYKVDRVNEVNTRKSVTCGEARREQAK